MNIVFLEPLDFGLNVRPASKEISSLDSYILEFDSTDVSAGLFLYLCNISVTNCFSYIYVDDVDLTRRIWFFSLLLGCLGVLELIMGCTLRNM